MQKIVIQDAYIQDLSNFNNDKIHMYCMYCIFLKIMFLNFSILDQQQKQSLPFQGGQWLGEFDGRIFVSSQREIYALVPVAIEKQVK